ncbi:MAG: helix-turn-helix transcriptional regulator [Gammaproteobacteria bacterium]
MPERTKIYDTLILAIELLRLIPKNRKVSAGDLHRQLEKLGLERDLRTIQRQLRDLSEHFDIERDESDKPYGYRWKEYAEGFSVPTLNEQQSLLLTLAEEHLRNLLPPNLMQSMQGFFAQAKYNLGPHKKAGHSREWLSKVRVVSTTQPLIPAKVDNKVFTEVSTALYTNHWLKVDYQNASGHRAEYEVMPLGLAQQGPGLYLVCRFKDHDNERSLALHRIRKAHTTTLGFKRPKEFDLKEYDDDGRFGFGEGKRIRLSFVIDKEAGAHLLETPLSLDQKVEEREDGYKITATVVDSGHLQWWLQGFGERVRGVRRGKVKGE